MALTSSLHRSLNLTLTVTGRGPVDSAFWLHFFHSSSHLGNVFKHKKNIYCCGKDFDLDSAVSAGWSRAYLEAKIPLSRHYEQKRS